MRIDIRTSQTDLTKRFDDATRLLAAFAGGDYRGHAHSNFRVAGNDTFKPTISLYATPLTTLQDAGKLQGLVDEMTAWAADLHKKYDFAIPAADSGSSAPPPVIPGALMVSPTSLSFSGAMTQVVQITAGGQDGSFTAMPQSDNDWLRLSKTAGQPKPDPISDVAPGQGTYTLLVTIDPGALAATTRYGSIVIKGTGPAKGTAIINVTLKPAQGPSACDLDYLSHLDKILDWAKAEMSLISDYNKTMEGAQATLKTSYLALLKIEDDFNRRVGQNIVNPSENDVLYQEFNLGTDRKDTSAGYIACVSDIDGKTPTTTNINYSLLYQDIPHWSASAGVLMSFQKKTIIGIADQSMPNSTPPVSMLFQVTDSARVQLVPMAYVNYRPFHYWTSRYGKGKEDELVWTLHLSGGFGVNPNTGTNQPEFFAGLALGLNRFMLHPGVHFGRTESLGGGFTLNGTVPTGVTAAPISWSYHPAFSIGFSVRLAPY
jgi:hypothetical protein